MATFNPSLTTWNRLEPRPRTNDLLPSLAARVRDPAWFLFRQWQTGEFAGQDVGSPAFVTVGTTTSEMTAWNVTGRSTSKPLNKASPLEKQALAEPFSAHDLSLSVEIGLTFRGLLAEQGLTETTFKLFRDAYPIAAPGPMPFNQPDAATTGFLAVCGAAALDGSAVYGAAKQGTVTVPIPPGDQAKVTAALTNLISWVQKVWGDLGEHDPDAWAPRRLEYTVQIQAESPDATGIVLDAHPDRSGELPWSAFDVAPTTVAAPGPAPAPQRRTMIPGHVRFRGIAAPRFWDFESNELALPSVKPELRDVGKVMTLDFMLIHGADWFVVPIEQTLGTLARVDALVVTDVFGAQISVGRADALTAAPSPSRWTMFTPATPTALAPFFVASPTAGNAAVFGPTLERVRFARDEVANMVWGIENATASPIGRPRPGPERDAAQDQVAPVTPGPSTDTTSPLRYQVETKVPVHWVPFLGVSNPIVDIERAAMVRPDVPQDPSLPPHFVPVLPIGKILNPEALPAGSNYQLADEEVPRDGVVVERVVVRSRWTDGSRHLWISRRRQTGAGETASALRFDLAIPTEK
jgi:hypothetical protein